MSAGFAPWQLAPPASGGTRAAFLPARLSLLAAAAAVCCVLSRAGLLQGAPAAGLAIVAIAIAMAHGSYDHVQARQLLSGRFGYRWAPIFLGSYVLLAGIVLLGWRLLPFASLLLFLGYSAWHFGMEPERSAPVPLAAASGFALGAVPIVAACHWQGLGVTPIFAQMLGRAAANAPELTQAFSLACWPVLGLAALGIVSGKLNGSFPVRVQLAAATALQVMLFVWCDPVVAFAVFFCCWHTPEHLLATSMPDAGRPSLRKNVLRNLRAGFVPWLLSLGLLGLAFAYGQKGVAAHEGQLFILLSALTVPHMALDELRRSRFALR